MDPTENVKLEPSWKNRLLPEFNKPYMAQLRNFLKKEYSLKKTIYPHTNQYFNAFNTTPFEKVKVVILGQDPYHGHGQAHGLSFSVPENIKIPPSLRNIFTELKNDLGQEPPRSGNLTQWAHSGVLLLNAVLTVEAGQPGSHQGKGWETFTDHVVEVLNHERKNLVFMLWGSYAQEKGIKINREKHLVLMAPHPSPFSAHRGFLGCKHFSKAETYLKQFGNLGEFEKTKSIFSLS
ncbi:MAG: uracil-DNA glycosylase [Bdellovibrionales bacterium]|nr:uracil-DNA glycosylase [Bdellovibrionales bacterium]